MTYRKTGETAWHIVRAMHLAPNDYLIGAEVVEDEGLILSISENGFGLAAFMASDENPEHPAWRAARAAATGD